MQIFLSPQRRDDTLEVSRFGDILTINGNALDLSGIPAGATLPAGATNCPWISGPIERTADGVLQLKLFLPLGPIPDPAPPEAMAVLFPEPINVVGDGPIPLPSYTPLAPDMETPDA